MAKGLSSAQFEVVLALAQGELHGYAIMQESARRNGAGRLGPATLYRSIRQLLDAGLIEEASDRGGPAQDEDQRRRYYRLSARGRQVARAEAERLAELVGRAQRQGLIPGADGVRSRSAPSVTGASPLAGTT